MNKQEFGPIVSALRTYYSRFNMLPNAEAVELWYQALQDLPGPVLSAALNKWVTTEKWPPTVAELRALSAEVTEGKLPDWGDAWEEVKHAVRYFGYMREKEALDSLSPLARATARRLTWNEICCNENPDTLRAQFRQIFESQAKRETEDRQLPPALKETIAQIGAWDGPKMIGGAG